MLSIVMIICGLKLNIYKLRKIFGTMIKLTLFMFIVQTIIYRNVSALRPNYFNFNKIFMYKMDWWIFSSALSIPSILRLKYKDYGKGNGMFDLLISEASIIQAVLYIFDEFMFLRATDTNMGSNNELFLYIKQLCITIIFAVLWGVLLIFVHPWKLIKMKNDKVKNIIVTILRILLLCIPIILYELIFKPNNLISDINQSLICFISSSMATTGWMLLANKQNEETGNNPTSIIDNDDDESQINSIVNIFEYILDIFQGFYCMGIGYVIGIYIKDLHFTDFRTILSVLIVLAISLMIHIIIITSSVWRSGFNRNEVIYLNMAYVYDIPLQTTLSLGILNNIYDISLKNSSLDEYYKMFYNNQLIIFIFIMVIIMSNYTRFLLQNVSG